MLPSKPGDTGLITKNQLFYTVREVQALLGGISQKTVYRLLQRGHLKASAAVRHKLITADSIAQFVNQTAK